MLFIRRMNAWRGTYLGHGVGAVCRVWGAWGPSRDAGRCCGHVCNCEGDGRVMAAVLVSVPRMGGWLISNPGSRNEDECQLRCRLRRSQDDGMSGGGAAGSGGQFGPISYSNYACISHSLGCGTLDRSWHDPTWVAGYQVQNSAVHAVVTAGRGTAAAPPLARREGRRPRAVWHS